MYFTYENYRYDFSINNVKSKKFDMTIFNINIIHIIFIIQMLMCSLLSSADYCGVAPGEVGYKASMTQANCIGQNWTSNNCINDVNVI